MTSLTAMFRLVVLFFAAFMAVSAPSFACEQYGWPTVNNQPITNRVERGVIRLQVGQNTAVGTAFLVDDERGLFLTAKHVIQDAIRQPGLSITGDTWPKSDAPFELKVFDTDDSLDVALLEIIDKSKIVGLAPIELGLYVAQAQRSVTAFGFLEGEDAPTQISGHVNRITAGKKEYEFRGINFGGDSGGPVFDNNTGLVIGIVTGRAQAGRVGVALGTFAFWEFLAETARSNDASTLHQKFLAAANKQELSSLLRPGLSAPYISNLDILGFIRIANKMKNISNSLRESAYCPVLAAVTQRRLDAAIPLLAPVLPKYSAAEIGRLNFAQGQAAWSNGEYLLASALLDASERQLSTALTTTLINHDEAATKFTCRIETLYPDGSAPDDSSIKVLEATGIETSNIQFPQTLGEGVCANTAAGDGVANLFRDLALTRYYKSEMQQQHFLELAKRAASLAVVQSASDINEASNMVLLGQIYSKEDTEDANERASEAFVAGWQSGYKQTWIVNQYRNSLARNAGDSPDKLSDERIKALLESATATPDLTSQAFADIFINSPLTAN